MDYNSISATHFQYRDSESVKLFILIFVNFIVNNCYPNDNVYYPIITDLVLDTFNITDLSTIDLYGYEESSKLTVRFIKDLIISVQELTQEQSLEEIKPLEINKCMVDGIQYIKYYSFAENEPYGFKIENGNDEAVTKDDLKALVDNHHPIWSAAIFPSTESMSLAAPPAPPNSPQLRF